MNTFSALFDSKTQLLFPESPALLYQPIRYIASLPSKKLRPFLVYLFFQSYAKDPQLTDHFWRVCASVEMMHNFSLIHDDIMDADDWRRGQETVHRKWDVNTAILSGDGLLALAFDVLSAHEGHYYREAMREFSRAVLTVCEGQALDKAFENETVVSETAYIDMIYKKTASLIEASCVLGAYAGNAPGQEMDDVRNFGVNLGLAFQLQDDYLDIFGSLSDLGKDIGSDLLLRKKTLIMIEIMRNETLMKKLDELAAKPELPIEEIKDILEASGIAGNVRKKITEYTGKSKQLLNQLTIKEESRNQLWALAEFLENRSH